MAKPLSGIQLKRFLKHRYSHDLDLIVILENIQYARNVAEVFRIADATKISRIMLTGISQKPPFGKDLQKVSRSKERSIPWDYFATTKEAISKVKQQGYLPIALEITEDGTDLTDFLQEDYPKKIAIIVGNEGYGITKTTLELIEQSVMLPMFGKGASLNVSVSLAIFIYFLIINNQ